MGDDVSIYKRIDPTRLFQLGKGVSQMQTVCVLASVGTNRVVVPDVALKRAVLMGMEIQSDGAAVGTFNLKDGSSGTIKHIGYGPINTATPAYILPIKETGYWETSTGNGIYVDVGTTQQIVTIHFIQYAPE